MAENQLQITVLPPGLDHPEGVAWGPDGKVYAGGEAGQLYRFDLGAATAETFASTGGFALGLAHDADSNVYLCDSGRRELVKITPGGEVSTYSNGSADQHMVVPNYPVFDADGNLYVSDSGDWGSGNGFIWRLRPGGQAEIWDRQATGFTNGMCLGPDGRSLYIVESTPPLISKIPFNADGTAGKRTVIVELPRTVPDGVAFDSAGNLYISFYNPNLIQRFGTDGRLVTLYDDWEQLKLIAPTNIAFGGPDLKTLLIASLCGWNITSAPVEIAGLPVKYPKIG